MDGNPLGLRALLAATTALVERDGLLGRRRLPAATGHALVAQIEHAIDRWATPASLRLEELFAAARTMTADPPLAMIHYLERAADLPAGVRERRQSERASLLATVTAIPLASCLEPCGEPFRAIARDASEGGMSLLHTRAVTAELLALRWPRLAAPRQEIAVLFLVHRCQPLGPFYEVAGQFVAAP